MTAEPWLTQVMSLLKQGQPGQAIQSLSTLPEPDQSSQLAQRLLAAAYAQSGQLPLARSAITRALNSHPLELSTRALAARIYGDLGEWSAAFQQLETLVQAMPQQINFWRQLWQAAKHSTQVEQAWLLSQRQGVDLAADLPLAKAATLALLHNGHAADALRIADQVWSQHQAATDLSALATAQLLLTQTWVEARPLRAWDRLREAGLDNPAKSLRLLAESVEAHLLLPVFYADATARSLWRQRYAQSLQVVQQSLTDTSSSVDTHLLTRTTFRLAYHGEDDVSPQSLRGDALTQLMAPLTPSRGPRVDDERKRVAFVSRHVRDCTVGQYFKHFLIDTRDEKTFVSVYCFGTRDAFSDEVAAQVDSFQHWPDGELETLAKAIAADAPDVMIYLEVGMDPTVEKLAAMRLAPLQVALWGHPVTTGLSTIDVYLSAADLEPDNAAQHYRERLQLLPGLATCYPKPPAASGKSSLELGVPTQGLRLVCAQTLIKWTPEFVAVVGQILRKVPTATLLLFEPASLLERETFIDYVSQQWRRMGITPATRLCWLSGRSRADFLATLAACDLALDTFGFSGGNTTLDALSVGLPVVTLPGAFMRGRQSMAMLRKIGQECLIASDETDYQRIVESLLNDEKVRSEIRSSITVRAAELFGDHAPVMAFKRWLSDS